MRIPAAFLLVLVVSGSAAGAEPSRFETAITRNVPYYEGDDADAVRHKLDLYLPKEHKDFPVLVFVHGGGWVYGSKEYFGLAGAFARNFTRCGIGVVCINYRLSPQVRHPEHIRDVAEAFAWTHRNIGKYGGRKSEIFLAGHSAGGHLVSLLATDATYLKAHGLDLSAIRGVMPISGLFVIPNQTVFNTPFGRDADRRADASPINHANGSCPPFLVMCAEREFPYCDGPGALAFCKKLQDQRISAQFYEIPGRNHITIMLNALSDGDPLTQSMLGFIITHVTLARLADDGAAGLEAFAQFLGRYAAKE